jgi:hypothetical protein
MRGLLLIAVIFAAWLFIRKGKGSAAAAQPTSAPAAVNPDGSDLLDNIMQAIDQMEGGHAGQRNVVNNNPGNVKAGPNMTGTAGGYATFADVGDGWDALKAWIQSHAAAHPDWDFYDMFNAYLGHTPGGPTSDKEGNGDAYAEYVANYAGVDPTQTVSSALGA